MEDHTDSIRFVSWASNDPPTLELDTWYRFENIKVNEYKGDPQIVITRTAKVTEIEPEEAQLSVETIHHQLAEDGAEQKQDDPGDSKDREQLVDVQTSNDQALLQQCPECGEVYISDHTRECSACEVMTVSLDN